MIAATPILYDPFGGNRRPLPAYAELDYVLTCVPGSVGELTLTLAPGAIDPALLLQDARIGVERSVNGRAPTLDGDAIFLLQDVEMSAKGTVLRAAHANTVMHTRVIAYASDGVFVTRVAGPADNQIKALARENLGALINGALRYGVETQADLSSYLSIAADLSQGASVPIDGIAGRYLDEVIKDLCQQSAQNGVYLTCLVEAISPARLELRTYAGQRGVDRTQAGQRFVLSEANGRVENVTTVRSWRESASMIYALGAGDGGDRAVATAFDSARAGASPFGRREKVVEAGNTADLVVLQGVADAALRGARETVVLTADLRETATATRGIHYDLGDILIVHDDRAGLDTSVRLDTVRVTVGQGKQQSQAQLRSV